MHMVSIVSFLTDRDMNKFKRLIFKFTCLVEFHFPAIKKIKIRMGLPTYTCKPMGIYSFISNEIREGVLPFVLLKDIKKQYSQVLPETIHPFNETGLYSQQCKQSIKPA